jgi:hypothetical protein
VRSFASTPGWTQILDGVDPIQNNYQNDFAAGVVLVRASDGVNYGDMNQAGILGGLEEVVAATSGATYVLTLDTCGWVNNSVPGTIGYELYDPASSMTLASAPGVLFLDDWTFFFTAWELRGRYPRHHLGTSQVRGRGPRAVRRRQAEARRDREGQAHPSLCCVRLLARGE